VLVCVNRYALRVSICQLYVLFVLADGGKDLESFSVKTYDVARSILMQVCFFWILNMVEVLSYVALSEMDCW
jgi:hypothetical protein